MFGEKGSEDQLPCIFGPGEIRSICLRAASTCATAMARVTGGLEEFAGLAGEVFGES